jgi:hypothetical protein
MEAKSGELSISYKLDFATTVTRACFGFNRTCIESSKVRSTDSWSCRGARYGLGIMRHTCLASVMVGDDGWDQCSQQAIQIRPGPLGLAWLAGLVGLVLAPSRLGRRIDGSESWTEYRQEHESCELYLFDHSLYYIRH